MISKNLLSIKSQLPSDVTLVAVSKFKPMELIMEAYNAGQRVFGENRPLELEQKAKALPGDIQWQFIGHLQTNKIKNVLPYASLVQSVDSLHLLEAIDSYAANIGKKQSVLLELYVAEEESKQGFTEEELLDLAATMSNYPNVELRGLMAMASFTSNQELIISEFSKAASTAKKLANITGIAHPVISMGMSGDWPIAIQCGSNMIRIGTAIFGGR